MIDTTTIEMLSGLAERLHAAGVFGQEVTSADKAFAVLLKGHELGFSPMASAGSISIIKGKVSLSADATIALCKRSPACLYLRLVESSEEVATYETQRHGDPSPTSLSYTIAQARTAGLTGSQTWRAHAPAMLRARCGAAIARAVYPDLVAGIYDPDEVAEIVRSGIQAVPKGQWEAAGALGLRPGAVLKLVVLPQALRVIIPPMTSQFLNLTKNSSLAVAIGYQDVVSISGTMLNQTGQAIEGVGIIMAVFLCFSLSISLFMNWYNARIALVER
jgi:hypothetical protein